MDTIEAARLKQLDTYIPDWRRYGNYLYIGAGPYRFHFQSQLQELCLAGAKVDVVEVDQENCDWLEKNCDWLKRTDHDNRPVQTINCCDVRDLVIDGWYGCVIWSHGPETVELSDAIATLNRLEGHSSLVVCMAPWGTTVGNGNLTSLTEVFFAQLGYAVHGIGGKTQPNSNLLAWKHSEVDY